MKRFWSLMINFWFVVISTAGVLVLCELLFQKVLFSDWEFGEKFREPGAYADIYEDRHSPIFSEEYWKLYYLFDGYFIPPKDPHPLLGWIGTFNRDTYLHDQAHMTAGRIPVLLFGDSFSSCYFAKCFQEFLNSDTSFSKKYYFLNYGVGGYGVDQIYLLARKVIPLYENPIVIFGLMTRDMDRNILKFRTGQKPYFEMKDDILLLHAKISSNPDFYVQRNMPDITSYLYRYLRNSIVNYIPENDMRTIRIKENMINLNHKIMEEALKYLRKHQVNHRFLVFSALYQGEREWRNFEIRNFLEENKAPYLWIKDLIERDSNYYNVPTNFYEQGDNGHPTDYQNSLISNEIKRILIDSAYASTVDSVNSAYFKKIKPEFADQKGYKLELMIRRDPAWMAKVRKKAEEQGISIDSMLKLDVEWMKQN